MNKLLAFFVFLVSISCATDNSQSNKADLIAKNEVPKEIYTVDLPEEPYNLQFQIETTEDNRFYLIVNIDLYNGSHYISPYAKRDFKGKFYMDLGSYTDLGFEGEILETPRSTEEFDPHPFVGGTVNWVRVNTTYKQPLQVKSQEDFEVFGRVIFTIEPRCTLENIPFVISYRDGEMTVKKNPKC